MGWKSDTAKEYQKRAEELRATAERKGDQQSKDSLVSLAAVHERLAVSVEDLAVLNKPAD